MSKYKKNSGQADIDAQFLLSLLDKTLFKKLFEIVFSLRKDHIRGS